MSLAHNRSQFIKTSQKSRYKGRNGLIPVYVNNIEQVKNVFGVNLQERISKQNSQAFKQSKGKEEVIQKIRSVGLSTTMVSSFNQNNLSSHRQISSNERFRSTSQSSLLNYRTNNSTPRPSSQLRTHNDFEVKQRFNCTRFELTKTKFSEDKIPSSNRVNGILSQILQKFQKQQNLQDEPQTISISSQRKRIKSTFLKKRMSLDRNLFHNILKSKIRSKLFYSSSNYSNHFPNTLLHSKIKQKIPNEFRDFIGPEEVLRMTRIFSGIRLKSTDMNDKIQTVIRSRQREEKIKTLTSEGNDLQTLKSIKRW